MERAAANANGLCSRGPGRGPGLGLWMRRRAVLAGRGHGAGTATGWKGPDRRDRSAGWVLAFAVPLGRWADRDEAPPCGQSHRRRPGIGRRLPSGLGGPVVVTTAVSLKMVTFFLLACL